MTYRGENLRESAKSAEEKAAFGLKEITVPGGSAVKVFHQREQRELVPCCEVLAGGNPAGLFGRFVGFIWHRKVRDWQRIGRVALPFAIGPLPDNAPDIRSAAKPHLGDGLFDVFTGWRALQKLNQRL